MVLVESGVSGNNFDNSLVPELKCRESDRVDFIVFRKILTAGDLSWAVGRGAFYKAGADRNGNQHRVRISILIESNKEHL